MRYPVFDLHCDTVNGLLNGKKLYENNLHVDLKRAEKLGGFAQCFAVFTTSFQKDPVEVFEKKKAALFSEIGANGDRIDFARTSQEIEKNQNEGKMSAILTLEGTCGIGCDPHRLEGLFEEGFRMVSLCWNEENELTGSCARGGGLTPKGVDFVREAQRLGFLVDVSHISDTAFWDIVKMTRGPIVASHSNSRSVHPHRRNLTDDMFRAICESGGTAGINLYADFVGDKPDLDSVSRHVLHFLELDPSCTHLSLGSDLDGSEVLPRGFDGVEHFPHLAEALLSAGLSSQLVHRIFWDNALSLF